MNVNVDVFAVTKIKVDQSFPPVQFLFNGSDNPYRLDVNGKSDGTLFQVRSCAPQCQLKSFVITSDI